VAICAALTTIVPPVLVSLLRIFSFGYFNYLPAGPTPVIFAILAQYHAIVPRIYNYRLAFSTGAPTNGGFSGLTFSDKSYRYLLALQLAVFQWPGSVLGAMVGWTIGYIYRNGLLPVVLTQWRIPGWLIGMKTQKRSEEFEGLRRRLEGENNASATSTGIQGEGEGEAARRRNIGQQILDQFRGGL